MKNINSSLDRRLKKITMWKNYIKTTLRSLMRNFKITFINLIGLTIAFSICIFILMYVHKQLSFDKFNQNYETIYRLEKKNWSLLASGVAPHVKQNFPEIEYTTRIGFSWVNNVLNYKENLFTLDNLTYTDQEFFQIFSLDVISGDPEKLLKEPYSMVLSEPIAKKIFGEENPIGKTIKYNNEYIFTITGIVEKREDFHIQYDVIVNFETLKDIRGGGKESFLNSLGPQNYLVYMLLNTNMNIKSLENKINDHFIGKKSGWTIEDPPGFWLREFSDIYLNSNIEYEMGCIHGNRKLISGFSMVGILVLLIAGINYVNITTARGMSRFKEVSIRKIVGSGKVKVFLQFIVESIILSALAFLFSLLVFRLFAEPVFNYFSNYSMSFRDLPVPVILWIVVLVLFTGVLAGLYPAFYLSSVAVLKVFKDSHNQGIKKSFVKQALIILQFTISVILIIGALIVNKQYKYMKNTELGFNADQIMVLHIPKSVRQNKESIKNSLLKHPGILKVSYAQQVPGMIRNTSTYTDENIYEPYRVQYVDPNYLNLLEIELVQGRSHDWNRPADKLNSWVINETAIKKFQIPADSVIGYQLKGWSGDPRTVIGVMKDFHFNSLQKEIVPLVFIWHDWSSKLHIKVTAANLNETIAYIGDLWKKFVPGYPFDYTFVDQEFNKHYKEEEKLGNAFTLFALLAIVIAAIGMHGLASYIAERNSRQISIRKVYGANIKDILLTFSKEFLYLVIIANLFAWPVAYYIMTQWLDKFPYKTQINAWIFILAGIASIIISLSTVGYNAYLTAIRNPAQVLRYE